MASECRQSSNVRQAQGDLAGALAAYEADLAIAERLAASDPGNAGWQRDLIVSQREACRGRRAAGDGGRGGALWQALAVARELGARDG